MIDPTTVSMIRDIVAIFGVIAGFSYYVLTVQATRRNQQQQLETRQAQLLATLFNTYRSIEFRRLWHQVMVFDWKDFDDWEKRFSEITNAEAMRARIITKTVHAFQEISASVKTR